MGDRQNNVDVHLKKMFIVSFQALLMESNDMRSQVAQARDAAVEVMNKSERYTTMVEPELTHLNQKWEEIMQRLKVCEAC